MEDTQRAHDVKWRMNVDATWWCRTDVHTMSFWHQTLIRKSPCVRPSFRHQAFVASAKFLFGVWIYFQHWSLLHGISDLFLTLFLNLICSWHIWIRWSMAFATYCLAKIVHTNTNKQGFEVYRHSYKKVISLFTWSCS